MKNAKGMSKTFKNGQTIIADDDIYFPGTDNLVWKKGTRALVVRGSLGYVIIGCEDATTMLYCKGSLGDYDVTSFWSIINDKLENTDYEKLEESNLQNN